MCGLGVPTSARQRPEGGGVTPGREEEAPWQSEKDHFGLRLVTSVSGRWVCFATTGRG